MPRPRSAISTTGRPNPRRTRSSERGARLPWFVLLVAMLSILGMSQASAQDDTGDGVETDEPAAELTEEEIAAAEAEAELIREGATVYQQVCSSCHQPGGIGVSGQYPPLINNPHVEDADYLRSVITTGRAGEIVVNGVTYDGVMPSFSTLPDADADAVIAYIQAGFITPTTAEPVATGPVAGTDLPALTDATSLLAFAVAAIGALGVLGPRIISRNDRLDFPWLDAWLRTGVIVAAVVLLLVIIPDMVLRTSAVAGMDRFFQDAIGVGLWGAGLAIVIGGLYFAHRESRI